MYIHLGPLSHNFVIEKTSNTVAKITKKIVPIDAITAPALITHSFIIHILIVLSLLLLLLLSYYYFLKSV